MSLRESDVVGGVLSASAVPRQESFAGLCPIAEAVELLASAGSVEARGAVFTRPEVAEFLLDLTGYTSDKPLHQLRLLEPAFGNGDFLLRAIERLLAAWQANSRENDPVPALSTCIRAVELHRATFAETRQRVIERLLAQGISAANSIKLVNAWLINDDFLLTDLDGDFDVVIGNPPYVRQELIPDVLMREYRNRYATIYDRADLYIPFIERSLRMLSRKGELGFICSDRWMKNRYGGPLRQLVAKHFHLKTYVDMVDTEAFLSDVSAYTAITVFSRLRARTTSVARKPCIESSHLKALAHALSNTKRPNPTMGTSIISGIVKEDEPWILDATGSLAVIRRLEATLPLLEEAGCKVGIGVATGADKAFIGAFDDLDVEPDRKLPLVMTKDIQQGTVQWRGLGVINPFADEGGLVSLSEYPRLRRYLDRHKEQIVARHCAQKSPTTWYRTIDRITPALARQPKLLIPDIKGESHIVYEEGQFYPHHNLYYITSPDWDLRALQAVLLSFVTRAFIGVYSTRMRGGFLRFQAQYLRRLRLPYWHDVAHTVRESLIEGAVNRDIAQCNAAVCTLYDLSDDEVQTLCRQGDFA